MPWIGAADVGVLTGNVWKEMHTVWAKTLQCRP
jgi:hypothetical protein